MVFPENSSIIAWRIAAREAGVAMSRSDSSAISAGVYPNTRSAARLTKENRHCSRMASTIAGALASVGCAAKIRRRELRGPYHVAHVVGNEPETLLAGVKSLDRRFSRIVHSAIIVQLRFDFATTRVIMMRHNS